MSSSTFVFQFEEFSLTRCVVCARSLVAHTLAANYHISSDLTKLTSEKLLNNRFKKSYYRNRNNNNQIITSMHAFHLKPSNAINDIDCTGVNVGGTDAGRTTGELKTHGFNIEFSPNQSLPMDLHAGRIIKQKNSEQKFFFGIELTPNTWAKNEIHLDYREFGILLPVFTSIVWLSQLYWNAEPIECSDPLKLAQKLSERTVVVSHFSAYRLHKERLHSLLVLNRPNILAVRGDVVHPEQAFKYTSDMVAEIRSFKADNLSIGVAGYPQGHPTSKNLEEDIENLVKKVDCGADYIITQICYSVPKIINFVHSCRSIGIKVPIMVGIIVPHSKRILELSSKIAHVSLDEAELEQVLTMEEKDLLEYFIDRAVRQITEIMAADIGIYGFQFYTMNRFDHVQEILRRLHKNGIIDTNTKI